MSDASRDQSGLQKTLSVANKSVFNVYKFVENMAPEITAKLKDEDIWRTFHKHGNEMILTKKGRNVFPLLEYKLDGLDPNSYYMVSIQMERTSNYRYKFAAGEWSECGTGEPHSYDSIVWHPDGAKLGYDWMRNFVSFTRMKITNNIHEQHPYHIILQSGHKFTPTLRLHRVDSANPGCRQIVAEFKYDFTEFIAVTAYQNQDVTRLKVANNKYAKGFRNKDGAKRSISPSSSGADDSPVVKRHFDPMQAFPLPSYFPPGFGMEPPSIGLDMKPVASTETSPTMPSQNPLYYPYYHQALLNYGCQLPYYNCC